MRSSKRDAAGVFGRSRELFEQVVPGWRTPAMPRPPPHMVAGQLRTGTIRSLQKSRRGVRRRCGPRRRPARPNTPTDKAIVERTFSSINTLFCQHVAGYTGRDVTRRGRRVEHEAAWSLLQLQDLLDEWIVAGWQSRPHDGLHDPHAPARTLSPNEAYAAAVAAAA